MKRSVSTIVANVSFSFKTIAKLAQVSLGCLYVSSQQREVRVKPQTVADVKRVFNRSTTRQKLAWKPSVAPLVRAKVCGLVVVRVKISTLRGLLAAAVAFSVPHYCALARIPLTHTLQMFQ